MEVLRPMSGLSGKVTKMHLFRQALFLIFLTFSFSMTHSIEIRSLWVTPWSLTSAAQIDNLIDDALTNNQNEILAEVRYRSDAMYIPNKSDSSFYNPEPRSYILPEKGFDPLEYLLDKAHENGIFVQAWVSVLCATPTSRDLLRSNYIFRNHPDWILKDAYGRMMNGSNYMGNFIDPGILAVRNHLVNVMLDIVTNYPNLDGVHLDYIRYPAIQFGHSSESLNRYKEACRDSAMTWNDWRILQVTDLIREFRERALQINPRLLVTAAVFADTYEAKVHLAQDWTSWLQEGLIDRAYPMAYAKRNANFERVINDIAELTDKNRVVIGLRAWQENYPRIDYQIDQVIDKAKICREYNFAGIALFSYGGAKKSGYFPQLSEAIYPPQENETFFYDEEDFLEKLTRVTYTPVIQNTSKEILDPISNSVKILADSIGVKDDKPSNSYFDSIDLHAGIYYITMYLDNEGLWELTISDENDKPLFQKKKLYPKGYYTDEWQGDDLEGKPIGHGVYTLRLANHGNEMIIEKKFLVY
jgi:uncharacterized lipoprotein YddW (UPF0748 family)